MTENRPVVVWDERQKGVGKRGYNGQVETSGMVGIVTILTVVMGVHRHRYVSKCIKWYILNMCSLLCVHYVSIKLIQMTPW